MEEKHDKLGRRIPQFDRSAAGKKSAKTQKEKYGPDYHSRIGTVGARKRTRGYFGKLKAEGKTEELSNIGKAGRKARATKEEKDSTGNHKTGVRGRKASTPGEGSAEGDSAGPAGVSKG